MAYAKALKIAVCDDIKEEREVIVNAIHKFADQKDHYVQVDQFESAESFLTSKVEHYSLVFLDIFMGEMNGMEVAEKLFAMNERIKIVFCSSSTEFAVQSYEVNALSYLVKPVAEERIFMILEKFFRVHTQLQTIEVMIDRMEESIYVNDIIWVEAARSKCIIHTKDRDYTTRTNFGQVYEMLPQSMFIKPIRYAIVALKAINKIPTTEITLVDGTIIPVSRELKEEVKRAYSDYQWKMMIQKMGGNA